MNQWWFKQCAKVRRLGWNFPPFPHLFMEKHLWSAWHFKFQFRQMWMFLMIQHIHNKLSWLLATRNIFKNITNHALCLVWSSRSQVSLISSPLFPMAPHSEDARGGARRIRLCLLLHQPPQGHRFPRLEGERRCEEAWVSTKRALCVFRTWGGGGTFCRCNIILLMMNQTHLVQRKDAPDFEKTEEVVYKLNF